MGSLIFHTHKHCNYFIVGCFTYFSKRVLVILGKQHVHSLWVLVSPVLLVGLPWFATDTCEVWCRRSMEANKKNVNFMRWFASCLHSHLQAPASSKYLARLCQQVLQHKCAWFMCHVCRSYAFCTFNILQDMYTHSQQVSTTHKKSKAQILTNEFDNPFRNLRSRLDTIAVSVSKWSSKATWRYVAESTSHVNLKVQ